MINFILDLLFPIHCLGCDQEEQTSFICPTCFEQMPLNKKTPLKFNVQDNLTGLIATSYYNHPLIKQSVYRYKYDFIKNLSKPLGQLMAKRLIEFYNIFDKNDLLLLPVPLHKKRLRWRGFNQAELLAIEIGQQLNIPVINDILIRSKHNSPQVNIKSSQQRKENIKQAFSLNNGSPQINNFGTAPVFILIDDICTTGSTLKECAKALKPLKPKEIWGLVIANG